jgi:hypothetical protein
MREGITIACPVISDISASPLIRTSYLLKVLTVGWIEILFTHTDLSL